MDEKMMISVKGEMQEGHSGALLDRAESDDGTPLDDYDSCDSQSHNSNSDDGSQSEDGVLPAPPSVESSPKSADSDSDSSDRSNQHHEKDSLEESEEEENIIEKELSDALNQAQLDQAGEMKVTSQDEDEIDNKNSEGEEQTGVKQEFSVTEIPDAEKPIVPDATETEPEVVAQSEESDQSEGKDQPNTEVILDSKLNIIKDNSEDSKESENSKDTEKSDS